MRINVIRNIIIALLVLIAADLFYLQVIRGGYFARQSVTNSIRIIPFEGRRGRILDRNGKVLADNEKSFCIAIVPQDQKDAREVFHFLAGVLDLQPKELESLYRKKRLTPFSPVVIAEDISRQQAIMVEENTYKYPGLLVLERYRRYYPHGPAGAHVIGYVDKADSGKMRLIQEYGYSADEPIGYAGVEAYYDEKLRASPGGRQIQVNSRGQQIRLLSVREPGQGKDLVLTIDQSLQQAAHRALDGRRGSVVILDAANGEVLALVSSPAYDPNDFSKREDRSRVAAYLKDPDAPFINRSVGAKFPPGSVFKVLVALSALQERKAKATTVFNSPGYFDLGDRRFTFAHAYGPQDLIQAMGHSANEYFFHLGLSLGVDTLSRYAGLFGLGEQTGIDLLYEDKGFIPRRKAFERWFAGDTANMSIGQGYVAVTPLQIARLMAVIENEGRFVFPHLVLGKGDPFLAHRFVSLRPEVWSTVKKAMRAAVRMETGTAHVLDIDGFNIYGKTGTAQSSPGKPDHSWFAGIVKGAGKTVSIVVLLEHGGSSNHACETTRDILLDVKRSL